MIVVESADVAGPEGNTEIPILAEIEIGVSRNHNMFVRIGKVI